MGGVWVEGKRASIIKSYGPALKVTCEVYAHSQEHPPAFYKAKRAFFFLINIHI